VIDKGLRREAVGDESEEVIVAPSGAPDVAIIMTGETAATFPGGHRELRRYHGILSSGTCREMFAPFWAARLAPRFALLSHPRGPQRPLVVVPTAVHLIRSGFRRKGRRWQSDATRVVLESPSDSSLRNAALAVRRKKEMRLLLIFATFVLAVVIPQGQSSAQDQLLCRGPLNYIVGTGGDTTVISFTKASSGGASALTPGTCALAGRAVAPDEPTRIFVNPETSSVVRAAFIAFTSCAASAKCLVEFLVHKEFTMVWNTFPAQLTDGRWRADPSFAIINYPAGW
jgi:hypothetical protein